jgi:pimeloyl-ACP methyl ester carboxylesterase
MSNGFNFPGKKSTWNGFERFDFELEGIPCIIVKPQKVNSGNPWVWRARFFDAFPNLDIAMLQQGWFLAHIDIADLYGSQEAMRRFDLFYHFLVQEHDFAAKTALEGFSRGGLPVFNWACRNPEKVLCIYADNPVCDFKSWPGGLGTGPGSAPDWQKCLKAYGLTEEQAMIYEKNPVDNVDILSQNNIPVIIVYGDADEVVPVAENTLLMLEANSKIKAICKTGGLHHPHCLEDPSPIVEFIVNS